MFRSSLPIHAIYKLRYTYVSRVCRPIVIRACERSLSGTENGAERAENRFEGSRAASGQNLPLKIRSTIKQLKVKSLKSILKVTTKLSM